MAPSFWGGFNDEPDREFPSRSAASLYRDSVESSPTFDDMSSRDREEIRERFIDDMSTGDIQDVRDWLDDLQIDWSNADVSDWFSEIDTSHWGYEDWQALKELYG